MVYNVYHVSTACGAIVNVSANEYRYDIELISFIGGAHHQCDEDGTNQIVEDWRRDV